MSILYRATGYVNVAASGRDYQMYLGEVWSFSESAGVTGDGMYAAAPVYLLEVLHFTEITGIDLEQAMWVTIPIAVITPMLLGAATYSLTKSEQAALLTAVISVPFPLFLRTATLMQAEHLAIVWFALLVMGLAQYLRYQDRRWAMLVSFLLISSAFLHFLYSLLFVVLSAIVLSTVVLMQRVGVNFGSSQLSVQNSVSVWSSGLVIIIINILYSPWDAHSVGFLLTIFDISIPLNPVELLIPSSGTAGEAVGGDSSGPSTLDRFVQFSPLAIAALFAAIGGLVSIIREEYRIIGLITMLLATSIFASLIVGIAENLHFRFLYFAAVVMVILAGIGINATGNLTRDRQSLSAAVTIALVCIVVIFGVTGGASSFGNNVDSTNTDVSWALTDVQYQQLQSMEGYTGSDGPMPVDFDHYRVVSIFNPGVSSGVPLYINEDPCLGSSTIYHGESIAICHGDEEVNYPPDTLAWHDPDNETSTAIN